MAVARRTYASCPTTFGAPWGRPVTFGSLGAGGQWLRPSGGSPSTPTGVLVVAHGYGGDAITDLNRLRASAFRAAQAGVGRHVLALRGTYTDGGAARTWYAHPALLPRQLSYPWAAGPVGQGERRTSDGRTYYCITPGTCALPAPVGSGDPGVHLVTDGGGVVWRCVAIGTADTDIPDLDWVAGTGRVVDGITRPEGVVREWLRTCGCAIDRRRIDLLGYSTGGGLVDVLLRNYADLFTGALDLSGCGAIDGADNWAIPSRPRKRIHAHGTADVTVGYNGPPSSAAVGAHPSAQATVEAFAGEAIADLGDRLDIESTQAGSETEVWGPATDPLDEEDSPVLRRLLRVVGQGHVPSINTEGHRALTRYLDIPGAL